MSSRNKINCGHCGNTMERRHLKDHTSRVHQGQFILEKVALNQPVLKVVLKEPDSKRVHSDGNENKKGQIS